MRKWPAKIVVMLLRIYKAVLSPFLGQNCRFQPGCANYAMEAVERHGVIRGAWMAIKRIGRCHPWHDGGYDPVPECKSHQ